MSAAPNKRIHGPELKQRKYIHDANCRCFQSTWPQVIGHEKTNTHMCVDHSPTSRPGSPAGPVSPGGPTGPGGPRSPLPPEAPCFPGSP